MNHSKVVSLLWQQLNHAVLEGQSHQLNAVYFCSRAESGSDDPDNLGHLGHFFGGSSGSHPAN